MIPPTDLKYNVARFVALHSSGGSDPWSPEPSTTTSSKFGTMNSDPGRVRPAEGCSTQ